MRRIMRVGAAAAVGAALVIAAAPPADAAELELHVSHGRHGPFIADFLEGKPIALGEKRTFHARVTNTSTANFTAVIDDLGSPSPEYKVKYFRGGNRITDEVHGFGHEFVVKAGKSKRIKAKVKAKTGTPPACLVFRVLHDDTYIASISLNGLLGCI